MINQRYIVKSVLLMSAFLFFSFNLNAQLNENSITLSGGYAFAKSELVDGSVTGWRINGVYEFAPYQNNFGHGLAVGYTRTTENVESILQTLDYTYNAWPIYYTPRWCFGKENFNVFVNAALGIHFSNFVQKGVLGEATQSHIGFYGGLGGGLLYNLSERFYIDLEYNWAFMANAYYKNGFMNSAMLGIGFRF